jgi:hypothetical protein
MPWTPTGGILVLFSSVLATSSLPAFPLWPNSTSGLHPFLTFDYGVTNLSAAAPSIQFIWGGHAPVQWHAANSQVVVSAYITYNRDPDASRNLSWWQANHPTWVLYKCDRVTPANIDPAYPNVALDVSNPEVVAWQVSSYAASYSAQGFDAIAADNFDIGNWAAACGIFAPNGTWVQLYNTSQPSVDPTYVANQVQWLSAFRSALHALQPPLRLIPNFALAGSAFNSQAALGILQNVDGILDERGFTGWGSGFLGDGEWRNIWEWARALQAAGKGYYSINEWGGAGSDLPPTVRSWVAASWAMVNEGASGVFMSCVSVCYGYWRPQPEYALDIGSPLGPATAPGGLGTLWRRSFERGLALLNPTGATPTQAPLPSPTQVYVDAQGREYKGSVALGSGQGLLLQVRRTPPPSSSSSSSSSSSGATSGNTSAAYFTPNPLAALGNPWVGFVPYLSTSSAVVPEIFPHALVNQYFPWASLQAGPGNFTFEPLDAALASAATHARQLIVRIYLDYPGQPTGVPLFLRQGLATCAYPESGGGTAPDYGNETLVGAMVGMIAALGARYDGDARVGFVQVGFLGHWGEWHSEGCAFAPPSTQAAVLGAFTAAFHATRVLARYPDVTGGLPAVALGVGWHDDSFFQDTLGPESWQFLQRMARAGALQAWQRQPIGGEVRPELQGCIFAPSPATACAGVGVLPQDVNGCIDSSHASWQWNNAAFSPPGYSAAAPSGGDRARALAAAARMGYALTPLNASVTATGSSGGISISISSGSAEVVVAFVVENKGVAPPYYSIQAVGYLEGGTNASGGGGYGGGRMRLTFDLVPAPGCSLALLQPGEGVVLSSPAPLALPADFWAGGEAPRVGISFSSTKALRPILPAVDGIENATEGIAWAALVGGSAGRGGGSGSGGAAVGPPSALSPGAVTGAALGGTAAALGVAGAL